LPILLFFDRSKIKKKDEIKSHLSFLLSLLNTLVDFSWEKDSKKFAVFCENFTVNFAVFI